MVDKTQDEEPEAHAVLANDLAFLPLQFPTCWDNNGISFFNEVLYIEIS